MNTTLTDDIVMTAPDRSTKFLASSLRRLDRRPVATALSPTVQAVRDALDHIDEGAVLAVPIGTPHQNFDVVEWCAGNGKQVLNRFDPWPLESLLVENTSVRQLAGVH
jgi:hypothetical protein